MITDILNTVCNLTGILDALKLGYVFTGNITKHGITMIKSTTNKSYCDSFSD